jgi:hypothetical protein
MIFPFESGELGEVRQIGACLMIIETVFFHVLVILSDFEGAFFFRFNAMCMTVVGWGVEC